MPLRKIPVRWWPTINRTIYDMVAIKPTERRLALLRRATPCTKVYSGREFKTHGLLIHHAGGIALKHADLKWLLQKGYVTTTRVAYGSGWAHDLADPAPLRRSYAQITDTGRAALERGKL